MPFAQLNCSAQHVGNILVHATSEALEMISTCRQACKEALQLPLLHSGARTLEGAAERLGTPLDRLPVEWDNAAAAAAGQVVSRQTAALLLRRLQRHRSSYTFCVVTMDVVNRL